MIYKILYSILVKIYKIVKPLLQNIKEFLIYMRKKSKQHLLQNRILTVHDLEYIKPKVVLYLAGKANSSYQGNMWFRVLEKIDAKVAVVVRDYGILYGLDKTNLPIIYIKDMFELEYLEIFGVRTILYPSNTTKVSQSLRLYRLNHYFINHGESDKVVNQSKLLMAYDKLLLAGKLAHERLIEANLPLRDNQIVFVGRPQVELFLKVESISSIHTILYAPTWEGFVEEANYTSVGEFGVSLIKYLGQLSKHGMKIYFKPHPFTAITKRNNIKEYYLTMINIAKESEIQFIDFNNSIYDYMNLCDLMITDISSVISDFLYTEKPMILTNSQKQIHERINKDFTSSKSLYILDNPENINNLIVEIQTNDYLKDVRLNMKNDVLGNISDGYFNTFNKVINESLSL